MRDSRITYKYLRAEQRRKILSRNENINIGKKGNFTDER